MKALIKKVSDAIATETDPGKDRSAGLVVFGTLDMLLGLLCFALAMLLLVVVSSTGLQGLRPLHYWMGMGLLFCSTAWYIVLGMGSIKAKRWARALLVVGAWVAVFFGTLALALVLYILPEVHNLLTDSGLIQPELALDILYSAIVVLLFLHVVFPFVAVAFYNLESVRRTCERRNPEPSWTDRCPLPLLAMGFISTLGCSSIIVGATTNYTVFLYGHIVSGWQGLLVVAGMSAACGYVGWGAFTRKMHAWWGAYTLVFLTSSSLMLTFAELDMDKLYIHLGYTAEQIEQQWKYLSLSPTTLTFISGVWGVMASIYLVWVRDCFTPKVDPVEVKSYQQRKAEEDAANPEPEAPRTRMRLD